jgi:hypothetical protein
VWVNVGVTLGIEVSVGVGVVLGVLLGVEEGVGKGVRVSVGVGVGVSVEGMVEVGVTVDMLAGAEVSLTDTSSPAVALGFCPLAAGAQLTLKPKDRHISKWAKYFILSY